MGKFSFPGRKKQAPQVTVTVTAPVMSKAQKILGSTALNIDDEFSASKVSLAGTERSVAPSFVSSFRGSSSRVHREWGDESEIVPRQFRTNTRPATSAAHEEDYDSFNEYGDFASDMASVLRRRQSSSTLASWYDKSKQPLSISQQTSNSAMAKGFPTKAQKMLDMDDTLSNLKARKKPAKLDLSQIIPRRSKKTNQQQPWDEPILGVDQIVKSPSLLSPVSSSSLRGRLTKRPTKESLRSLQEEHFEAARPETPHRVQNHLEGLPNLYEHYEQMSFRQVMNQDPRAPTAEKQEKPKQEKPRQEKPRQDKPRQEKPRQEMPRQERPKQERSRQEMPRQEMPKQERPEQERPKQERPKQEPEHQPQKIYNVPFNKSAQSIHLPAQNDEHVVLQYAKRTLPQTPQTSLLTKAEASSPTDCAASVSSRHTRTSKASKRTDRSFQDSDLQEKSVLSLSSDSEDELYVESSFKGPSSVPDYPISDTSSFFEKRPQTSRTSQSADNKRFSKASKRTSVATSTKSNNFLTIPNPNAKPPTVSARSSSLSGSSANTIQEGAVARSPSQLSSISNTSSVNTTITWQSKTGLELHQARAVTMRTAQGPSEKERESETDSDLDYSEKKQDTDVDEEFDTSPMQAYVPRDPMLNSADQPTPPLSPSSVDFYIRSAHSSIDGQGSHNRFMAVTRQEEMLLAALRHKRQVMRENILSEMEDNTRVDKGTPNITLLKGHISKPSEATITETTTTESNFDFDFPAPPMCKNKTTVTADGTTVLDLRGGSSNGHPPAPPTKGTDDIPRARPALSSSKKALLKAEKELRNEGQERILLYFDHPLRDENGPIEEAEPSPDLSDFMEFETQESEDSGDVVPEAMFYQSQARRPSSNRSSSMRSPEPVKSQKTFGQLAQELDVPRPDSPISPDPMSRMPRRAGTVNKKTARLSAVGPARWGYED